MYCIYVYSVSSPYLLMCGDDHICGIREQMMLMMGLMRHKVKAGLVISMMVGLMG